MPRSPFNDPNSESPDTKRRRRPWWRWHLVTLAVPLVVVVWVRQIAGFPYDWAVTLGATWLGIWATLPKLVIDAIRSPLHGGRSDPLVESCGGSSSFAERSMRAATCLVLLAGSLPLAFAFASLMFDTAYWYEWREFPLIDVAAVLSGALAPFVFCITAAAMLMGRADRLAALRRIEHELAARETASSQQAAPAPGRVSSSATIGKVDDE
ncbi:MAG: hypothetical protein ACRCT8_02575 [Lacipirellulaceae bacterium]